MRSLLRPLLPAAAIVALAVIPAAARAHFIWATIENGQARFALLEDPAEPPSARFASYVAKLTPRTSSTGGDKGRALTLGAPKDGASYAALPAGENVVMAESVVGARERDGQSYLLVYHAKGAASLPAAGTATRAPAEITARRDGDDLVVSVLRQGVPVAQAEVWVYWPGAAGAAAAAQETGAAAIQADARGQARTPWPAKPASGFVGVRAMVSESRAGEEGGKRYAAVRRWATLTFPIRKDSVPATRTPAEAAAQQSQRQQQESKPFRRLLRESFGNSHEIVSNAAFNQTLFAGKLRRDQLVAHLQQRALVHDALHQILSSDSSSREHNAAAAATTPWRVLYGPAQQNVRALLREDLVALGAGWPTPPQALPLTRAFLREIQDSQARGGGPYFALGVQHVYYGGITNGGPTIGKKIGETLGFTPGYYAKSDGYWEYLEQVDKVTDPQARQEMIRGGQAAYRYIIAISDEDLFKARAREGARQSVRPPGGGVSRLPLLP